MREQERRKKQENAGRSGKKDCCRRPGEKKEERGRQRGDMSLSKETAEKKPGNWHDIKNYAERLQWAAESENRGNLARELFFLVAELICADGPSEEGFGFDGDEGIICRTKEEAEAFADMFDMAFGEKATITGTWERDEDERDGCVDEFTGHSYVKIW